MSKRYKGISIACICFFKWDIWLFFLLLQNWQFKLFSCFAFAYSKKHTQMDKILLLIYLFLGKKGMEKDRMLFLDLRNRKWPAFYSQLIVVLFPEESLKTSSLFYLPQKRGPHISTTNCHFPNCHRIFLVQHSVISEKEHFSKHSTYSLNSNSKANHFPRRTFFPIFVFGYILEQNLCRNLEIRGREMTRTIDKLFLVEPFPDSWKPEEPTQSLSVTKLKWLLLDS